MPFSSSLYVTLISLKFGQLYSYVESYRGTNRNQIPSVVMKILYLSASLQLHLWEVRSMPLISMQCRIGELTPVTWLSTSLTISFLIKVYNMRCMEIGTGCSMQYTWATGEINYQQSELLIKAKSQNSCDSF